MKHLLLFIGLFLACTLSGQISQGGKPYSFYNNSGATLKAAAQVPVHYTKELNIKQLSEEDKEFPTPYRYSVFEDISVPIKTVGLKTLLPDSKGTIWRYQFNGGTSRSLQVFFETFKIPKGAKVFLYTPGYEKVYGAFTHLNNSRSGNLMLAAFEDNDMIIEYYEPLNADFDGDIVIGAIGKGYKEITEKSTSIDEKGLININCPEGEDWQNQKHSVCKLTYRIGQFGYTCTGALINNSRNDGTPFFLTANHCIDNADVAETVVGYFNYERNGCFGDLKNIDQTLSGSTLITTGEESDYTLLQFNSVPPVEYLPFYSGWDVTGSSGSSSVGIHHPGGDIKKICVDFDPAESYEYQISWEDNIISPAHSHWLSVFELGVTYGGSSGSPLFNDQGKIIGQLHGGSDNENFYGKLSHSWRNSDKGFEPLKSFLDPDNSGIKTLDPYYPLNNTPDPQFYSDINTVCKNAPIHLKAYSAFDPSNWKWTFTPDAVSYLNGTSSTSASPYVMFTNNGYYTVSLQATNASGTETILMTDRIFVDTILDLQVLSDINNDSCLCNFDSILVKGYGATSFEWSLDEEFTSNFYIEDSVSNPIVIKSLPNKLPSESVKIGLQVKGTHGQCTTMANHSVKLINQENDHVATAIQVNLGQNGIFSNICTSIEENEPVPPYTSCTGQDSWCDEYGTGEDIVEHSVWFYYVAETTGNLIISSVGFDNQIAVYQADTYKDILNGNFKRLGANDDYTAENFNPKITNLQVEKDKKYWIQVDGSGGGTEGEFFLFIDQLTSITEKSKSSPSLKVYPIPSNGVYFIESEKFLIGNPVQVEIFNLSGQKVFAFNNVYPENNTIRLDLTHLKNGIYVSRTMTSEKVFTNRLLKQ